MNDLPEGVSSVPGTRTKEQPHIIEWHTVPGKPKTKVYVSSRGIPLLCQSPSGIGKPIVTMENYCKWYGIDILHPDGSVTHGCPDLMDKIDREFGHKLMGDHNYHPRLLEELAKRIGGIVDWRAVEMAGGRWVSEIMDGELPGLPKSGV